MKIDAEAVRELIMTSVFEVFEKMYYIFLEPRESEACNGEGRTVEIVFDGGGLSIQYADALAQVMVENALGMDKGEMTEQVILDCLKECINMICGSFLQKYEPDRVLQLSMPLSKGRDDRSFHDRAPGLLHLAFESEGMTMDAVLWFADGAGE
jgi:hypothetical protein